MLDSEYIYKRFSEGASQRQIARELNVSHSSVQYHIEKIKRERPLTPAVKKNWIEHPVLPTGKRPVKEIIKAACENYLRKREHHDARSMINVGVKMDGPIGLTMLGDPHLDDNGCNWPQLISDLENVGKTEGMMLAQIGDVRNNWVGRLAKLYANQSMTSSEAREVIEWLFKERPWLFMVKGNHDHWNNEGGDVLDYIARAAEIGADMAEHEARVALNFPNGNVVTIRARHNFAGKSMYNTTHGMVKAALLGRKYDIMVCGDWHHSGYSQKGFSHGGWGFQADGPIVSHMIRLGAYKEMDAFAEEKGFEEENYAPAAVAIINPYAKQSYDKVVVMNSVEHGCDYLTYLRKRWASGKL